MSKVFFILPVIGFIGLGALATGYDSAMGPVRAERAFLKQCNRELRGQGVAMGAAGDACDCMMARTRTLAESGTVTPGAADQQRISRACIDAHIAPSQVQRPLGPNPSIGEIAGRSEPVDDGGWGVN